MKFFELFALKGEKKRLKYLRYETEEMLGHLQALVESYQTKIKLCNFFTDAWAQKEYPQISAQAYDFKNHVIQGHEHTSHITAKAEEMAGFLAENIKDERMLQHRRLEMQMRTKLLSVLDLCKSLDHVLVQEALFFKEEGQEIFSRRIQQLVMLVQQEVALYEQIHSLLDEIEVENQNVREQLKHERYVEEEYESVSNKSYPQIRNNLGG